MNLIIQQISKNFGNVCFQILDETNSQVGVINVTAKDLQLNTITSVSAYGRGLTLHWMPGIKAFFDNPYKRLTLRPFGMYSISGDLGEGRVFRRFVKRNFLIRYFQQTMVLNNGLYKVYSASFGKQGSKSAVYRNDVRIANIYKGYKVIDDVHSFTLEILDTNYILDSLAILAHLYLTVYHSVNQTTKGVQVSDITTKDEYILERVR